MRAPRRGVMATLAAATVAVAGAGGSGNPGDGEYEAGREAIEKMTPAQKEQLREKLKRFRELGYDRQENLRAFHRDLEGKPNREELKEVMEAYCNWAWTFLSRTELLQLEALPPKKRIQEVIKLKASTDWWMRFTGGASGFSGWEAMKTSMKNLARRYVISHGDELVLTLPEQQQSKWKARLEKARSQGEDGNEDALAALIAWYLAGPTQRLPISDADMAAFEKLLPSEIRKRHAELPSEAKTREIRGKLQLLAHVHFASGGPEMRDLVTPEALVAFRKDLPEDVQKRLARDEQGDELRGWYFHSKLPPHLREGRSFGGRRPSHGGDPRRGGPRRGGPGSMGSPPPYGGPQRGGSSGMGRPQMEKRPGSGRTQ